MSASIVALPALVRAEPLLVGAEGALAAPLTRPQSSTFGLGGALGLSALYPVLPQLLIGGGLRLGLLSNGDPPSDPGWIDPGEGGMTALSAVARVRPFSRAKDARRGTGFYLELGGGGALTGSLARAAFDLGVGWGWQIGNLDLSPVARYLQVIQLDSKLRSGDSNDPSRDARLLLVGLELTLFDARPVAVKKPEPSRGKNEDRDHDGVIDINDLCRETPEDQDGFEDEDGCPDLDNDKDGIPDASDLCPNEPEDQDGFEDADGCPDPDNDRDGIEDARDACPNEPETINGVEDEDGCPDQGLIEMVNDRIVLEERVLFDFGQSRVRHRAWPVLDAIVKLKAQHPEWISLRVEGHSDARGDSVINQRLSELRAEKVRDYLIEHGIPAEMIEAVGYGASQPRDLRTTEEGYQRNRRVEFVVVSRQQSAPVSKPADRKEDKTSPPSKPARQKEDKTSPPSKSADQKEGEKDSPSANSPEEKP